MKAVKEMFFDEIKRRAELGASPREMHRKFPKIDLIDWMHAGQLLHQAGKLKQEWSPVKGDMGCAQEARYFVEAELKLA